METQFGDISVSISRTGYTGDLGYEIWMDSEDALSVWDLLMDKGKPFGITPTGLQALDMARIEAGLILLDVDYISSRHAIVESRKSSPYELGLGWSVKMKKNKFIGKQALEREVIRGPALFWFWVEAATEQAGLVLIIFLFKSSIQVLFQLRTSN